MHFTCRYCGKGSFTIVNDEAGSAFATCNNCGKTTPFEKQQMTHASTTLEVAALAKAKA
jgi:transcription elongation factor Elf1